MACRQLIDIALASADCWTIGACGVILSGLLPIAYEKAAKGSLVAEIKGRFC